MYGKRNIHFIILLIEASKFCFGVGFVVDRFGSKVGVLSFTFCLDRLLFGGWGFHEVILPGFARLLCNCMLYK